MAGVALGYRIAAVQTQLGTFDDTWLAGGAATMFAAFVLSRFMRGSAPWIGTLVLLLLWGSYGVYEWRMQLWSNTVIAPIRLDLALVIPVLVVVSVRTWKFIRGEHRAA